MFSRKKKLDQQKWIEAIVNAARTPDYYTIAASDLSYILFHDAAIHSNAHKNLMRTINAMAGQGWRVVSYQLVRDIERFGKMGGLIAHALMENPRLHAHEDYTHA